MTRILDRVIAADDFLSRAHLGDAQFSAWVEPAAGGQGSYVFASTKVKALTMNSRNETGQPAPVIGFIEGSKVQSGPYPTGTSKDELIRHANLLIRSLAQKQIESDKLYGHSGAGFASIESLEALPLPLPNTEATQSSLEF